MSTITDLIKVEHATGGERLFVLQKTEFDESKHPRDEDGKFSEGGSYSANREKADRILGTTGKKRTKLTLDALNNLSIEQLHELEQAYAGMSASAGTSNERMGHAATRQAVLHAIKRREAAK